MTVSYNVYVSLAGAISLGNKDARMELIEEAIGDTLWYAPHRDGTKRVNVYLCCSSNWITANGYLQDHFV